MVKPGSRQTDIQSSLEADRQTDIQMVIPGSRQTDRYTDGHSWKQTDRQTDIQTEVIFRNRYVYTYMTTKLMKNLGHKYVGGWRGVYERVWREEREEINFHPKTKKKKKLKNMKD